MKKVQYIRTLRKNGKTYPETRSGYEFHYFRTIGGTWAYYPTGSATAATPDGTGAKFTVYIDKMNDCRKSDPHKEFWRVTEKNTGFWTGEQYHTLKQAAADTVELCDAIWKALNRQRAAGIPEEV